MNRKLGANNGLSPDSGGVRFITGMNGTIARTQCAAVPSIQTRLNFGNHGQRHLFGAVGADIEAHRTVEFGRGLVAFEAGVGKQLQ